jgi:OmpA-OmpF porin, OOP family
MNRSKLMAAALLACLPVVAGASPGWYVGIDAGKTQADAEIKDFLFLGDSSDEDTASSTGFQLRGGYQFGRFFALELGVIDLGDFEYSFDPDDCPFGTGDSCELSVSTAIRGFTLSMVGILPLGDHWSLRARVGMSQMHTTSRQLNDGGSSESTDESGLQVSVGAGYKIDEHWEFLLNHTRIDALDFGFGVNSSGAFGVYDVGDTSMTSIGVNYHW